MDIDTKTKAMVKENKNTMWIWKKKLSQISYTNIISLKKTTLPTLMNFFSTFLKF